MTTYQTVTTYREALRHSELTCQEAAVLHKVSIDAVRSWSSGRRLPPANAIDQLQQFVLPVEEMRRALEALVKHDHALIKAGVLRPFIELDAAVKALRRMKAVKNPREVKP